ncbi:hypothetical protein HOP60_09155 [Halomonas daqingensis]|uniref:Uncharacterized protein n=1 Tax=Billgrantia desiderata TaxID=52021 RepID=A0ABS9B4L0_9GAMM|nr:hypothetical protein [Halomonas desiderata]MCE8042327.1 hypothetical protein [Halomonas desiderata]MCE8046902.1 hypothetical protein [Halomonas desiderata]
MDPASTVEGVFEHFQDTALPPGRARELMQELAPINSATRECYDQAANFNAQPADFLSTLLELKRKE